MQEPEQPPIRPQLSTDYGDLLTPGVAIVMDPDEAEALGAFEETALTFAEAWDANAFVEA